MVFLLTSLIIISRRKKKAKMKKYIYFLVDSPEYPNEIFANSVQEVKSLLLESLADESQILRITEAKDTQAEPSAVVVDTALPLASEKPSQMQAFSPIAQSQENREKKEERRLENKQIEQAKFFEEDGMQLKLENGKLFKKSWTLLPTDDNPEIRVKSKKTGKYIDLDKYIIEKLEWKEIKQHN